MFTSTAKPTKRNDSMKLPIALCCLALSAQAELITYTYTGADYTSRDESGLTGDRITMQFALDSELWGTAAFVRGEMASGEFSLENIGDVATDAFGNILSWKLWTSAGGLDLFSRGDMDGGGKDTIFGDRGGLLGGATVFYDPGTDHSSRWQISGVPDGGATWVLMVGAMVGLIFTRPARQLS